VLAVYVLGPHELELFKHGCRLADRAAELSPRILDDDDAAKEHRLTVEQLRKVIVALRLPEEEAAAGTKRPQRRGARGPYSLESVGV
jgi:hypothetical protein